MFFQITLLPDVNLGGVAFTLGGYLRHNHFRQVGNDLGTRQNKHGSFASPSPYVGFPYFPTVHLGPQASALGQDLSSLFLSGFFFKASIQAFSWRRKASFWIFS